jgi:predicted lysophospholipase L1 biosynthesis ABC-type transport system permease subunit
MLPMEIVIRGLHMERSQLRLGLVISSMIMVNSTLLIGSISSPARFTVPFLAFIFSGLSQYYLVRQSIERSDRNIKVFKELGASHSLLLQTLLVNVVMIGLLGSVAGFVFGVSALFAMQTAGFTAGLLENALLVFGALAGTTAGSYIGIRETLAGK